MTNIDRRTFIAGAAGVPLLSSIPAAGRARPLQPARRPAVISSGNGVPAVERAMELLRAGTDPAEAVVEGVSLVEDDPDDMSVGLGGLPNEHGVVQLDASVMHGPTHKAGAVAALENIRSAARVALAVLRRTDHVLIVGDGARRFAKAHGFQEENLLTDKARRAWLRWKENLNPGDDWLDDDQHVASDRSAGRPRMTDGTIHCAAVDLSGDVGACTTTSGLSYKIPGRVGDSPIIGAGMYVDNAVGAAGATGRGESVIQSCGAFQVVRHMAEGVDPTEACLKVLKWIADHTRRPELLNDRGEPNFNVVMYALRKDGVFGSACMRGRRNFAYHDGLESGRRQCAALYPA
ncbi:MAG: N(4)-(beta-N-acetylglucosaminyl)-L-asparaginase [Planctomycetota bacterium]|jgi:N4-(beta-N-acetylglucosaminyl)-L-asparaginase